MPTRYSVRSSSENSSDKLEKHIDSRDALLLLIQDSWIKESQIREFLLDTDSSQLS